MGLTAKSIAQAARTRLKDLQLHLKVPPPIVTAISMMLMWFVASQAPQYVVDIPGKSLAAIVIAAIGFAIGLPAIRLFRHQGTTVDPRYPDRSEALVVEGIYRYTRNPMYVGFAMLVSAWMVWLGNPVNIAVLAGFIAYITRFQIMPEEEALAVKFGSDYAEYKGSVRRWL